MPTTYTGDKTQTQLPADPPEPGGAIQVSLPADGDPPNASTWEQGYKVCADFIDWLMKPGAVAGAANYVKEIISWRAAIGHRRFAIDHLGFPAGQLVCVDINWVASAVSTIQKIAANDAGSVFASMPEWSYASSSAAAGSARALIGNTAFGPGITIRPGESLNDFVAISRGPLGTLRANNHAVLEFTAHGHSSNTNTTTVGIGSPSLSPLANSASFIGFRLNGGGDWDCVSKLTGSETVTASGVTASTGAFGAAPDRLRVEWHGETVADNATRAARFYVNGVLKATHTTNLPLNLDAGVALSDMRTTAGTTTDHFVLGPMRFRLSHYAGDSVL